MRRAEVERAPNQSRLAGRAGGEADLGRVAPAGGGENFAQSGAPDDEATPVPLETEAVGAVTFVFRQPFRQTVDLAVIGVEPTPVQADRGQATAALS